MLSISGKSRFAAIALMVLGVTNFMNTSPALAIEVSVSGTVGCEETSSSLSVQTNEVSFEAIAPGSSASKAITYNFTQGKLSDCSNRTNTVGARFASLNGLASPVVHETFTFLLIGIPSNNSVLVTATAPSSATIGAFSAQVELTLSGD
jgi:hypothetical protein